MENEQHSDFLTNVKTQLGSASSGKLVLYVLMTGCNDGGKRAARWRRRAAPTAQTTGERGRRSTLWPAIGLRLVSKLNTMLNKSSLAGQRQSTLVAGVVTRQSTRTPADAAAKCASTHQACQSMLDIPSTCGTSLSLVARRMREMAQPISPFSNASLMSVCTLSKVELGGSLGLFWRDSSGITKKVYHIIRPWANQTVYLGRPVCNGFAPFDEAQEHVEEAHPSSVKRSNASDRVTLATKRAAGCARGAQPRPA